MKRIALIALPLAALIAPLSAHAETLIEDSFTSGSSGYVSGHPSIPDDTTRKPAIDNTGIADNNWVFKGATYYDRNRGSLFSWKTSGVIQGTIRIDAPTVLTSVQGVYEFNTGQGGTQVQWGAVGFQSSTEADWFSASGGNLLWALVNPSGTWTIFENGTSKTLKNSTATTKVPAFELGSKTTMMLQFNPEDHTVALLIDEVNVSGWVTTSISGQSIASAGFRTFANPTSDPRSVFLDDFMVSNINIPEPALVSTVFGVLCLLAVVGYRKTKKG